MGPLGLGLCEPRLLWPSHQFRQLGDIGSDAPRLAVTMSASLIGRPGSITSNRPRLGAQGGEELSTHGRRPAINALVTAGDAPSISAQSCFSRVLGPGPRI